LKKLKVNATVAMEYSHVLIMEFDINVPNVIIVGTKGTKQTQY